MRSVSATASRRADVQDKIGEVARRAEVSIDTVRFNEREGLLEGVRRTWAGQRMYEDETVRRLAFVRRATGSASRWQR